MAEPAQVKVFFERLRTGELLRPLLLALLACGPAVWLLGRPLAAADSLPGAPSAGIYPLLHRFWAVAAVVPERFPSPGATPEPDTVAWLLRPLVVLGGPDVAVRLLMFVGLVASVVVVWRHSRTVLPENAWAAAAATGVMCASPAVVAGVTSGDLGAWQLWALLALPLSRGGGSVVTGITIALLAPTQLPTAFLPILPALRTSMWPLIGWLSGMIAASALGWPPLESSPNYDGWFAALTPALASERVFQVYVGFVAGALLLLGVVGRLRAWAGIGAVALLGALLQSPVPPECFLQLVPYAAAMSGFEALRRVAPHWSPATAVFLATALLAEGWKGIAAPVPLATATLRAYAPITELAPGPLLDLPATRGTIRRGLWFQTLHGNPIAAGADGLVSEEVARAASGLGAGTCADIAALGFATVVARREGAFRELEKLQQCLGKPSWDDGAVAVWRLGTPAP